jgi:hypothetical protein
MKPELNEPPIAEAVHRREKGRDTINAQCNGQGDPARDASTAQDADDVQAIPW